MIHHSESINILKTTANITIVMTLKPVVKLSNRRDVAGMMANACNPGTRVSEAGGLTLRSAWVGERKERVRGNRERERQREREQIWAQLWCVAGW
jgi:hypothetical protein